MSDFESDLKRQLAREADSVQSVPRDLAARIAEGSGPRSALWLRLAPVAVAMLFIGAVGLVMLRSQAPQGGVPAAVASSSPGPVAATPVPSRTPDTVPAPTPSPTDNLGAFSCAISGGGAATAGATGNLTAIRVGHQSGYDRVTLEFAGAGVPDYRYSVQGTRFSQDASGMPVDVQGKSGVKLVFPHASTMDVNGQRTYNGPLDIVPQPQVAIYEVKNVGDFERVLSWAIGVGQPSPCLRITKLSSPSRLVVDVQAP
jgi:hypothetical protein